MTYTPPTFGRFFGYTDDPTTGGSNSDLVLAAGTPFTGGHIPDITNTVPVASFNLDWGNGDLDYSNLITGVRPGPVMLPFKLQPVIQIGADTHRYMIERFFKLAMGGEGTITGTGPYVHPIKALGMGAGQLPTAMMQLIRDAINIKASGCVVESVDMTLDTAGTGTLAIEAHPLYAEIVTAATPTGVLTEPNVRPMLLRDMTVIFDGGSAEVGVDAFRFGFKNNNTYDRQVAGQCVVSKTLNAAVYKQWFPCYHRVVGRQTVTWGFDLKDSSQAHELRQIWRQVTGIVATAVDPTGTTDQVVINLPAGVLGSGGIAAGAATGDLGSTFNGQGYYDPTSGTDATLTVTNGRATAIAVI
jgi:hypothetical protein